jgi:biopolymer transport protein TolQ
MRGWFGILPESINLSSKLVIMINVMDMFNNGAYCVLAEANSPTVFQYFANSDFAGKIIVCALMSFSLLAWTVMLGKYFELRRSQMLNQYVEQKMEEEDSLLDLNLRNDAGPYASLVNAANEAHRKFEGSQSNRAVHMGHIENALQRAVAKQTIKYESKMILLGSIVSGSPFLGLLGTVWGVMDAFGGMASSQSAVTLKDLAPGVSGALLTTVCGLLVAIPAVFGYNFLLTQSRTMITEFENFASVLADRVELELEHKDSE